MLLPLTAQAKLKIVTTTTDFADIARQIGGDLVDVHSVMKGPENVHNVLAKPTEMVALNEADLFVHSGLDSEPWRDNLLKGARNPRVMLNKPGNADMSQGIDLKEVPTGKLDRSMGDVHGYGNPHYSINPQNAQRMTVTLLKAMIAVDPANTDSYKAGARRLVLELSAVSDEIRKSFAPYAGLKIITFHKAWDYFSDALPIDLVGTIEPKPSITPSAAQVRETVDMMRRQGVKIVVCETYNDARLARSVAEAAGAQLVVLPDHVLGIPQVDSYVALFRYNAAQLIEAAKRAGIEPKAIAR